MAQNNVKLNAIICAVRFPLAVSLILVFTARLGIVLIDATVWPSRRWVCLMVEPGSKGFVFDKVAVSQVALETSKDQL